MISVSLLSSYLYCKRKLFLERVLGLYEGPKEAPIRGKIRHKAYEDVNNAEEQIITSITEKDTFQDILQLYHSEYARIIRNVLEYYRYSLKSVNLTKLELFREIWPAFSQEARLRANNAYKFIKEFNLYGQELWQKLTPKIKSELKIISDNLGLIGKIDQLELHKETVIPIELKTGSSPKNGIWPGHKIQIAAYALLLEDQYHKKVNTGSVIYLDQNIKRTIIINPFLKDEIIGLRKEVEQLLTSKQLPDFTENPNKCQKCGLKKQCYDEEFIQTRLQELNKTFK
jgi:CRISPR-associated exonuclease Cas4